MQTVTLSDYVLTQLEFVRSAPARRQEEYDTEYEAAMRAAGQQQLRYDAEHEAAMRAAGQRQLRLDTEYEAAVRAAKQQQLRYDAEHEAAMRAAGQQQLRLDAEYDAAARAVEEQDRAIASLRMEAVGALRRLRLISALRHFRSVSRMERAPSPTRKLARRPGLKMAPRPVPETAPSPAPRAAPPPVRTIASARLSYDEMDELRRLEDSRAGEQRLATHLAGLLDDTWTLMHGYHNSNGEVDVVLVGPAGVCAVEVKYLNGYVYAEADDSWRRDKYDNYGNRVRSGDPIHDRSGRSPSQQVRAVALDLEWFLQRRQQSNCPISVRTAVILTHEQSSLGEIRADVDAVMTLGRMEISGLFHSPGVELSADEVAEVVMLIEQDHDYHERRRTGRPVVAAIGRAQGWTYSYSGCVTGLN